MPKYGYGMTFGKEPGKEETILILSKGHLDKIEKHAIENSQRVHLDLESSDAQKVLVLLGLIQLFQDLRIPPPFELSDELLTPKVSKGFTSD